MKVLSTSDQDVVLDYVTDSLDALPLRLPPAAEQPIDEAPQPKRPRVTTFDEFDDEPAPIVTTELQTYRDYVLQGVYKDLTDWWYTHRTEFPTLSIVARNVFCAMATSAASERNFSVAGNVVSDRRSCLKSSSVNDILFLNSARK